MWRSIVFRFFSVVFSLFYLFPAIGQSADKEQLLQLRKELAEKVAQVEADEATLARFQEEAQIRTRLCKTCHGEDGVARKPGVPNLAGQNPVYILDQFQRYADGHRYDFLMSGLAKSMSEEDRLMLALYYSKMPAGRSGGGESHLMTKGEALYTERCTGCHGTDGQGQEGYARLAGQQPDYLVKTLQQFRDKSDRRPNPWMTGTVAGLSNQDIQALAAYLANLP